MRSVVWSFAHHLNTNGAAVVTQVRILLLQTGTFQANRVEFRILDTN